MENALDEKAVEAEIARFCDFWAMDPATYELPERLGYAVKKGRVVFDDKTGAFTYRLMWPLLLGTKKEFAEVRLEPVSSGDVINARESANPEVKIVQASTKLPVGVVERLNMKDFTVILALCNFFYQ